MAIGLADGPPSRLPTLPQPLEMADVRILRSHRDPTGGDSRPAPPQKNVGPLWPPQEKFDRVVRPNIAVVSHSDDVRNSFKRLSDRILMCRENGFVLAHFLSSGLYYKLGRPTKTVVF